MALMPSDLCQLAQSAQDNGFLSGGKVVPNFTYVVTKVTGRQSHPDLGTGRHFSLMRGMLVFMFHLWYDNCVG